MKENRENRDSGRLWAILSLSMANALVGTGISPALAVMKEYFSDASPILIQMIVSLPSLLVITVAFVFPVMSKHISMRRLCGLGLLLFTVGGLCGGVTDHIYAMILTRVLIGLGYGIMMPLSVGLLAYFYDSKEQHRLNGEIVIWSSVSSIVCMMLAGYLAVLSWRFVFLVYLFGLPCLWLCLRYIPDETLNSPKNQISISVIKKTFPYTLGIFIIFVGYYSILNNCSSISVAEGTVSAAHIGTVMTVQTFSSLFTGKAIGRLEHRFGENLKYLIWVFAIAGFLCLEVKGSFLFLCLGLLLFGVALAIAVGTLNAEACMVCEREEALSAGTMIMFMRSLGQFSSPVILSLFGGIVGSGSPRFPYTGSLLFCSLMLAYYLFLTRRR